MSIFFTTTLERLKFSGWWPTTVAGLPFQCVFLRRWWSGATSAQYIVCVGQVSPVFVHICCMTRCHNDAVNAIMCVRFEWIFNYIHLFCARPTPVHDIYNIRVERALFALLLKIEQIPPRKSHTHFLSHSFVMVLYYCVPRCPRQKMTDKDLCRHNGKLTTIFCCSSRWWLLDASLCGWLLLVLLVLLLLLLSTIHSVANKRKSLQSQYEKRGNTHKVLLVVTNTRLVSQTSMRFSLFFSLFVLYAQPTHTHTLSLRLRLIFPGISDNHNPHCCFVCRFSVITYVACCVWMFLFYLFFLCRWVRLLFHT